MALRLRVLAPNSPNTVLYSAAHLILQWNLNADSDMTAGKMLV
jgi:hypothetical protein